ncbi:MAG: hypothetical protein IPO07_07140 [Haliscomenobacter sp.]|nr:hypothetical protein [Haliscomenobacter sp.]MBK9488575.1 hypothetical protein [Haliscomenobacter sp.]
MQIRLEEEEKRLDSLFKLADQLYLAVEKWESLSSKSRKNYSKKQGRYRQIPRIANGN